MKKLIALVTLGFALVAFGGCAGMGMKGEKPISKATKIRCPKCGAEFTVGEGINAYGQ